MHIQKAEAGEQGSWASVAGEQGSWASVAVSFVLAEQESEELMDQHFVGVLMVWVYGLHDFKI